MKIAVIGGRGFIGRQFVRYAEANGHEPLVIGSEYDVFQEQGAAAVKEMIRGSDALVFLAAKRPTAGFSAEDLLNNIRLAEKYMRISCELGIRNLVIASSIAVYSSPRTPWKENEFHTPLSLYGASKQAMDSIGLWYNANKGMKIKSLRLAQVIGIGERKGYLLNTLIDRAMRGEKQTIYGSGSGKRQYIYIMDVCDAVLHSLVYGKDIGGVFNIGMRGNIAIASLAELVNQVMENPAGIEMLPGRPEDTRDYLMDVSKAEKELRWEPRYNLEAAFAEIKEQWTSET